MPPTSRNYPHSPWEEMLQLLLQLQIQAITHVTSGFALAHVQILLAYLSGAPREAIGAPRAARANTFAVAEALLRQTGRVGYSLFYRGAVLVGLGSRSSNPEC